MIANVVILEMRKLKQENPEFANLCYLRKQKWGEGEQTGDAALSRYLLQKKHL